MELDDQDVWFAGNEEVIWVNKNNHNSLF